MCIFKILTEGTEEQKRALFDLIDLAYREKAESQLEEARQCFEMLARFYTAWMRHPEEIRSEVLKEIEDANK